MLKAITNLFPAHIHPLTLVSDPDKLFTASVRFALEERGFSIHFDEQALVTRAFVEKYKPFSAKRPLIIVTVGSLNQLPYDVYEQGFRLELSLPQFFPGLVYPVLRELSNEQISNLYQVREAREARNRSRKESEKAVLGWLFSAEIERVRDKKSLLRWLIHYYEDCQPMPDGLLKHWSEELKRAKLFEPALIDRLLRSREEFSKIINQQWKNSYQRVTGTLHDPAPKYKALLEEDRDWKEFLPALVHDKLLDPLPVQNTVQLEPWLTAGVLVSGTADLLNIANRELDSLLSEFNNALHEKWDWREWQTFAVKLSKIKAVFALNDQTFKSERTLVVEKAFSDWLRKNYARLAGKKLPTPHHVFHVPHYLAYQRSKGNIGKMVLLILDGFSLVDWWIAKESWLPRNSGWKVTESNLLAQIPTITSVSRMALISGLTPSESQQYGPGFPVESKAWIDFWMKKGFAQNEIGALSLQLDKSREPYALTDPQKQIWCLVDDTTDKFSHEAVFGDNFQRNNLKIWLNGTGTDSSRPLEHWIDKMLDIGFTIFIASDHGHTEAIGNGTPNEGTIAATRGKRARIYSDQALARRTQDAFPDSVLWGDDGLLPLNQWALMPEIGKAFDTVNSKIVTHGGLSLEEVIVPLITITKGLPNE